MTKSHGIGLVARLETGDCERSGCAFVARDRPTNVASRQLRIVCDRPTSIPELRWGGRSTDYKFSIVILDVNAEGKGDGLLYYAVKLKYDKNGQLELEHYGQAPGRIAQAMLMK